MKIKKIYRDLSNKELVEKAKQNAKKNINEIRVSYLSTFRAVYDLIETDTPYESVKMLSGFGFGFGSSGNICGALAGGMAILGIVYGSSEPPEPSAQKALSEIIKRGDMSPREKARSELAEFKEGAIYNQLISRFRKKFGSCLCKELFEPWKDNPVCVERYKNCHEIISEVAGMVMELLLEAEEKGLDSFEYGRTGYSYLLNG